MAQPKLRAVSSRQSHRMCERISGLWSQVCQEEHSLNVYSLILRHNVISPYLKYFASNYALSNERAAL
jgi:hypothetical protein